MTEDSSNGHLPETMTLEFRSRDNEQSELDSSRKLCQLVGNFVKSFELKTKRGWTDAEQSEVTTKAKQKDYVYRDDKR